MGWRVCSGFKHRKIHLVIDYESVRNYAKGYGRPIQLHATELVVPESHIFPLFQAEQAKVEGGSGMLPKISMTFEQGAPTTPSRTRKTYVTLDRAIRFGKTVGCKGCDRIAEGVKHSEACRERFRLCQARGEAASKRIQRSVQGLKPKKKQVSANLMQSWKQ